MSQYDYVRGAMDAEFVGHMTDFGNAGTLNQMRQQMDKLAQNAEAWKAHAEKLGQKLDEAHRALAETQKDLKEESVKARSLMARSNTIVEEAELCREIPSIKPVFSALGEDNREERRRLTDALAEETRRTGKPPKDGGLTKEQILQYHLKRNQGADKPDFDRS